MTLASADSKEAAVAPTVDGDPVRTLLGAERDGLLSYGGFVSGGEGGGYEVTLAGRLRVLPAGEVAETVGRLRAVAALAAVGVNAELGELRADGTHVLHIEGGRVELPAGQVLDWCSGFLAAQVGQGQGWDAGDDRIGEIAAVFEHPSLNDQIRMVILGLMHGQDENRVSADQLRELIGELPGVDKAPAKKTVVDALGFGGYLGSDLAENMIAAFGLRWLVTAGSGTCERAEGGPLAEPLPEMPALVALRRIVAAVRAGWLRYDDEPSLNKARWLRRYHLRVGEQQVIVGVEGLHAWLDGVAAFHAGRG